MKKVPGHRLAALLLSLCLMVSLLPMSAMAANDWTTIEYQKTSSESVEDGIYSIVSTTSTDNTLRILHLSNGSAKLDKCKVDEAGDTLTPTDCTMAQFAGTGAHSWTIAAVEGGYTIQTRTAGASYINLFADSAVAGADAQVLQIARTGEDQYTISRDIEGVTYYLSYASGNWASSTEPYSVYLYQETEVTPDIASGAPESGTTTGQPFAKGTGGSNNFRIPSLITLEDGTLLAAIDARWNHTGDACALDTIISRSEDNGQTWTYSFPNYFNDSTDAYAAYATAFIDPVMVQGSDGTIYLMVDAFPGGVALNTAPMRPAAATGYVAIDGVDRLVLYTTAKTAEQSDSNYAYYVGDYTDGFAPVISVASDATEYYLDEHFNLYDTEHQPIYCQQLGSSKIVQQNVFYYNADLHVRNACYLWLITSTDGGKTWSAPTILNDQVRTGNDVFYGVGPGAGLCLEDGTVILPCYTYSNQIASFIYTTDGGKTWTRSQDATTSAHWSSESCLVQIDDTTIRHFYRDGYSTLFYTDHTWDGSQWVAGSPVNTGVTKTYNNQLSAIRYSEFIDGKTAILVSTATGAAGSRTNGKIYTFLLNEDNTMTLAYTYSVTGGSYSYSSLTEQADGSIGLLYENAGGSALYVNLPIADVADGALVGNDRVLNLSLYGSYTETVSGGFAGYEAIDTGIVDISVQDLGDGSFEVTYTGLQEGTVEFDETNSGYHYVINVAVPEGSLTNVSVEAGDTQEITLPEDAAGQITHQPDADVATAEVISQEISTTYTGAQGNLGTDTSYNGPLTPMSDALYTAQANEDGTFVLSAKTADGTTVYLCPRMGAAGYPSSTTPDNITFVANEDGTFHLKASNYGGYLYFWRNGKNVFDQQSGTADATKFLIYQPQDTANADSDIPGYVQVTSADQITDGGQYLIVAQYDGSYFALYPSTSTSDKYAHVIKVNPDEGTVSKTYTETVRTLKITAVAPGTTDVAVDGTIYRITVDGYLAPQFDWTDDYSAATATFPRTDDGEPATETCTVTNQTTAATCTADGQIVYTASVTFGGKTYTDTQTVTLPALGHNYSEPKFTWSEDLTQCTAVRVCALCQDQDIAQCTVTSQVTAATCTADGQTVYSAQVTFDGQTYTDTQTVKVPATGHSYGEPTFTWSEDHTQCTATWSCGVCNSQATAACTVTSQTTSATSSTPGATVYTASVTLDGKTFSTTFTVTLPATGGNTQTSGQGNTQNNTQNTSNPKTGDFAPYLLLVVLLCAALAGCVLLARSLRKRRG